LYVYFYTWIIYIYIYNSYIIYIYIYNSYFCDTFFRHDGCLLPFAKLIESIPVIWIKNPDEELYAFECTRVALPVHSGGFWSRLSTSFSGKTIFSTVKNDYLTPALRLAIKHLPDINIDLEHLYSDVRLVLWGGDTVLRSDFASLTELLVEVCKMYINSSFYSLVFLTFWHIFVNFQNYNLTLI